jgi:hypothetical protein
MKMDPEIVQDFADELRTRYCSSPGEGEATVEALVLGRLNGMPQEEKISFLASLMDGFRKEDEEKPAGPEMLKEVFTLLLGKEVPSDGSPHEMLKRLSEAFSTLFETVNRIVKTIDTTLLGETSGEQTIRHVIGSQVDGLGGRTIEEYLGQIEKAFLVSHTAFRQAAHTLFDRILKEINPEAIATGSESRLKFGPMRKAEYFDVYEGKFGTLKSWFDSGRFMKDLLREFEKNCQTSL